MPVAVKRVALLWPWNILASHLPVSPFKLVSPAFGPDRFALAARRHRLRAAKHSLHAHDPQSERRAHDHGAVPASAREPGASSIWSIPPEHDGLTGPNVLPLLGSPNRIQPDRIAEARAHFASRFEKLRSPRIAVLLGGKNKAYRFGTRRSAKRWRSALADLAKTSGLMITASRRTGDGERRHHHKGAGRQRRDISGTAKAKIPIWDCSPGPTRSSSPPIRSTWPARRRRRASRCIFFRCPAARRNSASSMSRSRGGELRGLSRAKSNTGPTPTRRNRPRRRGNSQAS